MYVVVGLGNPGRKYEHTRHNVGLTLWMCWPSATISPSRACAVRPWWGRARSPDSAWRWRCRRTYMNLSGESVVQLVNWYKPERDQLIICFDDVDLPEGKLRFRPSGSAGTHNGMRNIIYLLGRDDFPPARGHRPPARGLGPQGLRAYRLSHPRRAPDHVRRLRRRCRDRGAPHRRRQRRSPRPASPSTTTADGRNMPCSATANFWPPKNPQNCFSSWRCPP